MSRHSLLAGTALAVTLALGATGATVAHGDEGGMGPGMMSPGVGPYPGQYPGPYSDCDWDDHGMGPYPHDGWGDE